MKVKQISCLINRKNNILGSEDQIFASGSSATTISSQTLATGLTIFKDWEISVDLKLTESRPEFQNVLSLQVEGTGQQT